MKYLTQVPLTWRRGCLLLVCLPSPFVQLKIQTHLYIHYYTTLYTFLQALLVGSYHLGR